jgi:uncharacterized Tic20 family protein
MTTTFLRHFLKGGLYLAAILLLPGALIGAPILWWLGHRRRTSPPMNNQAKATGAPCTHC